MRTFIVALLVFALIQISHAQKVCKALIDSLYAELPKMKEDTNKVRVLATICYEMRNVNARDGLKPGLEALHLAEKLQYQYGKGLSYFALATCYTFLSNFPEQIDKYLKACSIFETLGEKNLLCNCYIGLANSYESLDSMVVREYMTKAIALLPQLTTVSWKVRNYDWAGMSCLSLGWQVDSARKYLSISQKLSEQYHLKYEIILAKARLGWLYSNDQDRKKLDSAFVLLKTSTDYFKAIGATRWVAENSRVLGQIRLKLAPEKGPLRKQYLGEALAYAQEALNAASEIRFLSSIYQANILLSDIFTVEGRHEKALEYFRTASLYNDSINGNEIVNKASVLSWKYEQELKNQQLELLKLRNQRQLILNIASATGVAILIIVVIVVIRNRRRLKKAYNLVNLQKEEIECQKEELENTLDKLKQTQSQLIQSEKMASLGMLTAGIAHEINNPVNFINSGTISLQKDYEDLKRYIQSIGQVPQESQKIAEEIGMEDLLKIIPQTIEDIKTGVQRTTEIVKGLRNFTRIDSSELKEINIHEGIDSTVLLLSHKITDKICIVKEFDERIGSIKCYPGPLNQVFMNLLNNAIDAIEQKIKEDPTGGIPSDKPISNYHFQIGITTKLMEEGLKKQVKIVISDNGVGVPDGIKDKLFDPFFTTKDVGKGTGLGLSICHGIIEKHGGTITFESKVNEGTVFTIILPVG